MPQQPTIIDIPGQGEVEFPASMSDVDIRAAVQRLAGARPLGPPNQHTFTAEEFTGPSDTTSSYARKMVGGAVDEVQDIGRGLADNVRRSQANSRTLLTGAPIDTGPGVVDRVKSIALDTPSAILSAINTNDPNEAGRRVVDALGYLSGGVGAEENAAMRGATRAGGRATLTGIKAAASHPAAPAVIGGLKALATGAGVPGVIAGVTGGGYFGRGLRALEQIAAKAEPAPTPRAPSPARSAAAAKRSANAAASERMVTGMSGSTSPLDPPIAPGAVALPVTPSDALMRELLMREPNWRLTDAVPIDAITRDITRGGSIIEAGESRIGLAERLARVVKDVQKNPTPAKLAEADRLGRALRQREHITSGQPRSAQ